MKNAVSSKGMFLPSEVPRNRVQMLILNITTTTTWQEKMHVLQLLNTLNLCAEVNPPSRYHLC